MANHLGSVFGAINGAQPSQKSFEDALFEKLITLKDQILLYRGREQKDRLANTSKKPLRGDAKRRLC
ncbi:hypothetical protein QM027_06455 [Campylobacter concisus]